MAPVARRTRAPRNSPEVAAAFQRAPETKVAEILDRGERWVHVETREGSAKVRAEPLHEVALELARLWSL